MFGTCHILANLSYSFMKYIILFTHWLLSAGSPSITFEMTFGMFICILVKMCACHILSQIISVIPSSFYIFECRAQVSVSPGTREKKERKLNSRVNKDEKRGATYLGGTGLASCPLRLGGAFFCVLCCFCVLE